MKLIALVDGHMLGEKASIGWGRPATWVRTIDIPEDEAPAPHDDGDLLDLAFRYGQNDFQPRMASSLSVGDLVILDDANGRRAYRCCSIGWGERVERHEMTREERAAMDWATAGPAALEALIQHQNEEAERLVAANGIEHVEPFRRDLATLGR